MAMSKIERIDKEIAKTREKITEYQNKLKGLEAQKTEAENLQIVQLVRSMRLTPQELTAMLSGNGIPGIAPMPADYEAITSPTWSALPSKSQSKKIASPGAIFS